MVLESIISDDKCLQLGLNKLIEDEFEFEDFDEKLEELIEEVQSFINSNNLREFVKDGRGGEELAEGVERLTDFAQDVIDTIA